MNRDLRDKSLDTNCFDKKSKQQKMWNKQKVGDKNFNM